MRTKMLAIIVLAVALGATLASSARAEKEFHSSLKETAITSTADGTGTKAHQVIDAAAGAAITCPESSYAGGFEGGSTGEILLTATFSGTCKFVGETATFSMKSCQFSFAANGTLGIVTNPAAGTGKTCTEDPIAFSIPSPACAVTIGPQTIAEALTYKNIKPGTTEEITVETHASGIKYSATGAGCPTPGHNQTNGNFTTGNKILTAAPPKLPEMGEFRWESAEEFHSSLKETAITSTADGTGTKAHQVIDAAGASITCPESTVAGGFEGSSAAELILTATFTGTCKFVGQTVTSFAMKSCQFSFAANGTLGIITNPAAGTGKTCAEDPITFSVPSPACAVTIGPQTIAEALTYKNIKPGTTEEITVETHATGLSYHATGAGCPETGTKTNGNYTTGNRILTAAPPKLPEMGEFRWGE